MRSRGFFRFKNLSFPFGEGRRTRKKKEGKKFLKRNEKLTHFFVPSKTNLKPPLRRHQPGPALRRPHLRQRRGLARGGPDCNPLAARRRRRERRRRRLPAAARRLPLELLSLSFVFVPRLGSRRRDPLLSLRGSAGAPRPRATWRSERRRRRQHVLFLLPLCPAPSARRRRRPRQGRAQARVLQGRPRAAQGPDGGGGGQV